VSAAVSLQLYQLVLTAPLRSHSSSPAIVAYSRGPSDQTTKPIGLPMALSTPTPSNACSTGVLC
jgi:hypothetical protein